MTCDNATDPSARANQALAVEKKKSEFRGKALETFLLYLFTYEMSIEKVRGLLDKVETQALRGFPDLKHSGWREAAGLDLLERLRLIEASTLENETAKIPPKSFGSFPTCSECHVVLVDVERAHLSSCSKWLSVSLASPEKVPLVLAEVTERLRNFAQCSASLAGDTAWLLERDVPELVEDSDRVEVERLVNAAWKSLGTTEELASLISEALRGKADSE